MLPGYGSCYVDPLKFGTWALMQELALARESAEILWYNISTLDALEKIEMCGGGGLTLQIVINRDLYYYHNCRI